MTLHWIVWNVMQVQTTVCVGSDEKWLPSYIILKWLCGSEITVNNILTFWAQLILLWEKCTVFLKCYIIMYVWKFLYIWTVACEEVQCSLRDIALELDFPFHAVLWIEIRVKRHSLQFFVPYWPAVHLLQIQIFCRSNCTRNITLYTVRGYLSLQNKKVK
jgi:hypothetical protein